MSQRIADIAVYSREGSLSLVAETKNRPLATQTWAAEYLRNLIDYYGAATGAPYFLLALPDSFYLWRTGPNLSHSGHAPDPIGKLDPHYRADAKPLLRPYLEDIGLPLDDLSEAGFALLVSAWLSDVVDPDLREEDVLDEVRGLLFSSGLRRAIEGGSVKTQAPV